MKTSISKPPALHIVSPAIAAIAIASTISTVSMAQVPSQTSDSEQLSIELEPGIPLASYSFDTIKSAFPVHDRVTRTPWTKAAETIHYRGVFLKDLLVKYGLDAYETIEVRADDGFLSQINKTDIDNYAPILAFERECTDTDHQIGVCKTGDTFRPLSVDESGPFFMIWPYDDLPEGYVPSRNNLWVWWVITVRAVR